MILSRKFCVYLHFTPLFALWGKHELRKRQSKFLFSKIQTRYKLKTYLKGSLIVLSAGISMKLYLVNITFLHDISLNSHK